MGINYWTWGWLKSLAVWKLYYVLKENLDISNYKVKLQHHLIDDNVFIYLFGFCMSFIYLDAVYLKIMEGGKILNQLVSWNSKWIPISLLILQCCVLWNSFLYKTCKPTRTFLTLSTLANSLQGETMLYIVWSLRYSSYCAKFLLGIIHSILIYLHCKIKLKIMICEFIGYYTTVHAVVVFLSFEQKSREEDGEEQKAF